ncbi:hypothetical protein N7533_001707 [Penicillium manginii]|uniref:uncharacterized protein n=1 Tax=Penicillium manginii TaxID=203109 RepID=UPI0025498790|nr:uncharacterized protein N7533_001707 [Penicillium manginii]KAJ5763026.1 hypothetical protein N7533_001707 [Penicillium manginii]
MSLTYGVILLLYLREGFAWSLLFNLIGTGLTSSFPFHAACDSSAGPSQRTFDLVLSSYTPTVKGLLYTREHFSISPSSKESPQKLLIVTMANTPGACDLPERKSKSSIIVEVLGVSIHTKILDQPDSASVISHIHNYNIAHFACHETSDRLNPSQNSLLL